ncbi:MAG: RuBisCO large subunit C-terminal-like domain-containing protein [Clostridiales bacterium]|nr:RuBisCO large subunit C-terminal-like domain-containing protein [Clostridiales bacterium]
MDSVLYTLSETIHKENYVIATYHIVLPKEVDIMKKASTLAIGQTIGTWIPIPGITDEIREKNMGKVVNVFDIPSMELSTQLGEEDRSYLIQIAYPALNFGDDLPLLITSLLGNDASTSAQVKLLDIEFPEEYIHQFAGPRYGISGIQELTGVKDRPLLLNMIKPCTGLKPAEAARIFYQTALGGVDFIKDDELLGNPVYSRPEDRVREFKKAAKTAYEETGIQTRYFVNVTCGIENLLENVKLVEEAGADGIMLNYATVGYSALKMVAQNTNLPILGHSAGSGMVYEGMLSGMASPLAVGKLARIAGADIVMINTPYGGYPLLHQKYMQTVAQLTLPFHRLKPSMPSIGGGVHPGMVEKYIKEVGRDIVLAAGGAVQGHPGGAAAGVRALRQAVDIVMTGQDFESAAKDFEELQTALKLWGYKK